MRWLARVARREAGAGNPLPQPIKALRDIGFYQLRGQLSLFVAAPGRGKSLVALHQALNSGIPTLYVSADTDPHDQIVRAATMLTGKTVPIELRNDPAWLAWALDGMPEGLAFEFDSNPSAVDLKNMVDGYRQVFGEYPHLIIIDTLGRVWSDTTDDESAMAREAVQRCQEIARHTGAHVAALHHAVKAFDDGNMPIPLSGVIHGVSKVPEQIVTMFGDDAGRVCFCPVKNRGGQMDASAMQLRAWVKLDIGGSLRVSDCPDPLVVETWRDAETQR